ncbi:MAG: hypothetical protein CL483_02495 [Acidobacteria bacterium]|nr:hypothetical protein [Acidobacteriota bacterium]
MPDWRCRRVPPSYRNAGVCSGRACWRRTVSAGVSDLSRRGGEGDVAPPLVGGALDADYVLAIVREGFGQMPPISTRELTDDQVRDIVGYIDWLNERAADPAATSRHR